MAAMTLADAKERLLIPELWRILDIPGTPSKSCRCPWREDHKPSFSVSDNGLLWNDFSTGEGGDSVDFLANMTGLSIRGACRKFLEMAGGHSTPSPIVKRPTVTPQAQGLPTLRAPLNWNRIPPMRCGTRAEHEALAAKGILPVVKLSGKILRYERGAVESALSKLAVGTR